MQHAFFSIKVEQRTPLPPFTATESMVLEIGRAPRSIRMKLHRGTRGHVVPRGIIAKRPDPESSEEPRADVLKLVGELRLVGG